MRKKAFVSKVFQMSTVMLFLNISNIFYNMYVSKRAGAEGIGTFHLVMSVFSLAVTVSVSGIGLTATRLVADMPSSLKNKCAGSVSSKCLKLVCIPAGLCTVFVFLSAEFLATKFLKNPQCAICLKILSATLLPMGFSAVITGYFTAFGRVGAISCAKAVSEAVTWLSTLILLRVYPNSKTYMAVVISLSMGIFSECLCLVILRRRTLNFLYCKNGADYKSIIKLCAPIAIGSYLRTGLSSAENLLIPSMLAIFGVANPVAQYGIIKGMTMPLLLFPFVFVGAFSSLIVPEIASRRIMEYKNGIRHISSLSVEYILKFGFFISAIFFKWHSFLGIKFFGEPDVGKYLGFLFIFPVLYFCDSVVDSVLKGMDQQVATLRINVIDSLCRVGCTLVFIPVFGMVAYIGILYLSELINLVFSYKKLKKVSQMRFPVKKGIVVPISSAFVAVAVTGLLNFLNPWAGMCAMGAVYLLGIEIFNKIL